MRTHLFVKQKNSSMSFVFALFISIGLMVMDYHYRSLSLVRCSLATLVSPLQMAVDYPLHFCTWMHSLLGSKKALLDENIKLHYQQTIIEARLQTFLTVSHENEALKALLSTSKQANSHTMAAELLAVDTSNIRQLLVLNKGSRDGVHVGLPVLDAKGIMGQVIDVGLMTSTVLMISDAKCAVPVRNNRTGERAILVGTNNISQLNLINFPKTSSLQVGDLLVTSGLGRSYPEGYPVGRVYAVKNQSGDDFAQVKVRPVAHLNRSRLVLLIWPEAGNDTLLAQINARLNALEGFS